MEPVKKSEAPDYYEIIRFPIGRLLCPALQDRIAEWGAEDPTLMVGTFVWGGGSLRIAQSARGMSWDLWLVSSSVAGGSRGLGRDLTLPHLQT